LKELFKKKSAALFCIALFAIAVLAWLPMLFTPFLSDDYQIVYWHKAESFSGAFSYFLKPYILHPYWRPLGSLSFSLTWLAAGSSPLEHHAVSLFFFGCSAVAFFLLAQELGLSHRTAFIAAAFFAVLPSRELPAGWLSCRGDTMAAIFLMLSAFFFLKAENTFKKRSIFFFTSGISYFLALLSKEVAFAGCAIPAILLFKNFYDKKVLKSSVQNSVIATLTAAGILAATLIYRIIALGGSPFGAAHFSSSNPLLWPLNFVMYIPLSFVSPDVLEQAAFAARASLGSVVLFALLAAAIGWSFLKMWQLANAKTRSIVFVGLAWFTIFAIPAVPTLMRWYAFTASAGLLWAIAALLENTLRVKNFLLKPAVLFLGITFATLFMFDISIAKKWQHSGNILLKALQSLEVFKNEPHSNIVIWAAPDKIDRVLLLKIGMQQTIQAGLQDFRPDRSYFSDTTDVISPLRIEGITGFSITTARIAPDTIVFKCYGARFTPEGARSSSIFKNEQFLKTSPELAEIKTNVTGDVITSEAKVWLPRTKGDTLHLFFDGKIFKKIE
jgi:hypothetical protein